MKKSTWTNITFQVGALLLAILITTLILLGEPNQLSGTHQDRKRQ